jgi:hypothetical protein
MTAAQPQSLDRQGIRSLEVRWILRGQLPGAVKNWFGRFPTEAMALEDAYLLDPHLPGLSVKVRAGRELGVKVYGGCPGLLEVPGRARGRLQSWQKWSFPHGPASPSSGDSAGWRLVSKQRRISFFAQDTEMGSPWLDEPPGCAVELTTVDLRGEPWWTLCFEATGSTDALRRELDAAAALVFADTLPGSVELGIDDSQSYAQWLRRQTDTG